MKYRTAYDHGKERYYNYEGKPIANKWQHVKEKGVTVLKRTGTYNVYEKIQEAYEETTIQSIMARVVNGDTTMLRANGMYIDTTQIPSNIHESMDAIKTLENMWDMAPKELKQSYNNNVEEFVADSGSEKWLKGMGYIQKEPVPITPIVKASETITAAEKGEPKE